MKNWKIVKRICNNGQFRAAILDSRGKFIIATEQYKTKRGLSDGLMSIKHNSADPSAYEIKFTTNGMFYFNLKSVGNHKVIAGPSRLFVFRKDCEDYIEEMFSEFKEADEVTKIGFWPATFEDKYGSI